MNPIASYLRHLIVTGIVLAATRWGLPETGLPDFAQEFATLVILTGSWALVKYAPELAKAMGLLGLMLAACLLLPACSSTNPENWSQEFNPLDPPGGPIPFTRTPVSGPNWFR